MISTSKNLLFVPQDRDCLLGLAIMSRMLWSCLHAVANPAVSQNFNYNCNQVVAVCNAIHDSVLPMLGVTFLKAGEL